MLRPCLRAMLPAEGKALHAAESFRPLGPGAQLRVHGGCEASSVSGFDARPSWYSKQSTRSRIRGFHGVKKMDNDGLMRLTGAKQQKKANRATRSTHAIAGHFAQGQACRAGERYNIARWSDRCRRNKNQWCVLDNQRRSTGSRQSRAWQRSWCDKWRSWRNDQHPLQW